MHLDIDIKFRKHIDYALKKLKNFSGKFYRLRQIVPKEVHANALIFFAEYVISHGPSVYETAAKTNFKKSELLREET